MAGDGASENKHYFCYTIPFVCRWGVPLSVVGWLTLERKGPSLEGYWAVHHRPGPPLAVPPQSQLASDCLPSHGTLW